MIKFVFKSNLFIQCIFCLCNSTHTPNFNLSTNEEREEEEQFLKSLESVKLSDLISRKLVKGIFLGVSESGKSCLFLWLTNKWPEQYSPSTGLCNSAINIEVAIVSGDDPIHHAITTHDSQVGEWEETNLDLSLVAHMGKNSAIQKWETSSQNFASTVSASSPFKREATLKLKRKKSSPNRLV